MKNVNCKKKQGTKIARSKGLCLLSYLFFSLLLTVSQQLYGQEKRMSIELKEGSLKEFVEQVKKQTGYSVWYRDQDLKTTNPISVQAKNEEMSKLLARVLTPYGLIGKSEGAHIVITKNNESATPNKEQAKHLLSGIVSDENGERIIGATVVIKGTAIGAVTNINGEFSIQAQQGDVLQISFIGYKTQDIVVNGLVLPQIVLREDSKVLEDVVVIGYGEQKKVSLTGSVTMMDMKRQENQPITNVSQAMHSIPGVYINQGSNKPGDDGATIRIRGIGTLGNSNPLVLVDGMEYSLNELNPENIEHVTVLKDASASIYGSKAANGVILITTKSGSIGKPKVSFSANVGFQQPTYLPEAVTDAVHYMELRNEAVMNEGMLVGDYSQKDMNEYKEGRKHDKYIYPNSNWQDIAYRTGMVQQYNLRVSGGKEAMTYSLAVGYMGQKGVLLDNDDASRFSWDLKMNIKATERLKIGASILGNLRYNTEPAYGVFNTINIINRGIPIMSGILPSGVYGSTWIFTPGRNNIENPLMYLHEGNTKRQVSRYLMKVNVDYKLPFNFIYQANVGYDKTDWYSKNFVPELFTYNPKTMEKKAFNSSVPRAKDYDTNGMNFTFYNMLSWNKTLKSHTISMMAGTEYKRYDNKAFTAYIEGFFNNQLTDLDAGSKNAKADGRSSLQLLSSYFARLNYNFKERYMLDVTARYDGSSKFAKDNRWSFFPAVSLAWRLDNEAFMSGVESINLFKIRGSWGKMGNQSISDYSYLSSVKTGSNYNYSFGNVLAPGAAIADFVDPSISWETTTSYNVGLDIETFNNRLIFSADAYKKRSDGILRRVALASQIGNLNGPMRNVGVVDNNGVEVTLNWRSQKGQFRYSVGGNFCYNQNIVIDLGSIEALPPSKFRMTKVGHSIDSWWLYEADGYYQTPAEVAESVTFSNKVKPGYLKIKNNYKDEVLNDNDRVIAGKSVPDITYSFNGMIGYKGLELSAQFQGVHGVSTYLGGNLAVPFYNGAGIPKDWVGNYWSEENRNAKYPILTTATGAPEMYSADNPNNFWLHDASYLRLKVLQLSYNLPKPWIQRMGLSSCQFFVNGHNLFTFSSLTMFDPEKDMTSTNLADYPSLKTYNVGVNITF